MYKLFYLRIIKGDLGSRAADREVAKRVVVYGESALIMEVKWDRFWLGSCDKARKPPKEDSKPMD